MEPLPRPTGARGRPRWPLAALVFGLAAVLRGGLAIAFPTIHGGDAAARLANPGALVLGYQLPLPQLFVALGRHVSDDPLVARMIFCGFGGLLAAGLAALLAEADDERAGLFAGLLVAVDPLLIHYSVVPYQEPLAYGLVTWSLVALRRDRPWAAAALMACATLCRYEAWLFLPLFLLRSRTRLPGLLAAAPALAWIAFWRGLAPPGLYVLDIDLAANRAPRVAFLLGKLIEYETVLPAVLALTGLGVLVRSGQRVALALPAWVAGAIVVVVGLGHEFPPGSGLVSERLIHLPVILMTGLAALALARISRASRAAAWACLALTLALGVRNARFEIGLLRAAAREPDLALARDAARAIEEARRSGECVTVTAPSVDPSLLRSYVAKVGASWGDVATASARAAALIDASPDRDRIAAHLRAPPGTVRPDSGCALGVSVDGAAGMPLKGRTLREISAGPRRAVLYRSRD